MIIPKEGNAWNHDPIKFTAPRATNSLLGLTVYNFCFAANCFAAMMDSVVEGKMDDS